MKKIFSIFLCLTVLVSLAIPASASLQYDYIDTVGASLTFDTIWGIANCCGSVDSLCDNDLEVEVTLRQLVDGKWVSLYTWRGNDKYFASASGSYAVARGYQYQVYVVGYVYDENGSIVETGTVTSTKYF